MAEVRYYGVHYFIPGDEFKYCMGCLGENELSQFKAEIKENGWELAEITVQDI